MTKNLLPLVLVFLFGCFSLSAQTTPVTDANFEQYLVDQGIDTNGANGNILDVDAQAVTALNITRTDITDFTGLEAFVNLVTLNAGTNQVPTLPLTALTLLEELYFARNTALSTLDLTQNTALRVLAFNNDTAPPIITTLDLSQNVNLENLNIRTVRSITSLTFPVTSTLVNIEVANLSVPTIDLSQLTGDLRFRIIGSDVFVTIIYPNKKDALKNLELSSINFPTVDVSEMIGLERFGMFSTGVESLLLPSTNTLTSITIWQHDFGSSLDLSPAPALTNLDIRSAITLPLDIDLTNNLLLSDVSLTNNMMNTVDITQNPNLRSFRVYDNNLTSLDVTQNLELNRLEAYQNRLPGINLSQNLELQYLNLSQNLIPNLDVTTNLELTSLDIGENLFTGTGLDLTLNMELRTLTADNNQIESLDITQNTELSSLNISNNIFPGTAILNQFFTHQVNQGRLNMRLNVENNLLSGRIPDFYGLYDPAIQTRRSSFQFGGNSFEFGDFEDEHLDYVALLTTQSLGPSPDVVFQFYTYAPHTKVNAIENPTRNAGESITLTTTVRGTQTHYTWFKDGVEILNAPDAPEYTLTDLNTCDAGVYHSEITSDLVPFENSDPPGTDGKNLLLVRNDITLTVNATKGCVTLNMPLVDVPINSGIQWNDNPGACGYKITVGTTTGATDIVNNEDVGEVTVYNFDSDLDPNEDYFVTITPYYDDGDFLCTEQSFTTNNTTVAPECTFLSSPSNNSTNVAADLSRIEWNPSNGADEYTITISSPSGANDITTTTTETFLTVSNNFNAGEVVTVTIIPENTVDPALGCTPESFTITNTATPPGTGFITTWETTAANETITIPTRPFETYDYTVDWGDGAVDTNVTGDITHTYTTPRIQTVSITGTFPQIHFNGTAVDRDKILTIEQWGAIEWQALTQAFKGCSRLDITNLSIDIPDLSNATNISEAFADCTIFNGDITLWNVSTITNMARLFHTASNFNQDIGDWDVSNVLAMDRVFESATAFNQDIGDWDVSSVTGMGVMFTNATNFNQDIGRWDVSEVRDMNTMFGFATSFNQDIGRWNVSNVENMDQMFYGATAFNQDISLKSGLGLPSGDAWNTSNVTSMAVMFIDATAFNQDIGNWNVANVTSMHQMFRNAINFDQDISNWNVSNVATANNMFSGVTLSTANYDALLIGWNSQNLQPNVPFGGGNSQYCEGATARANMISSDNWNIIDGGLAGPTVNDLADQNHANSYTLPAITGTQLTGTEAYYTEVNGSGISYNAGDVINFTDFPSYPVTLYIYDGSGSCSSEESFQLTLTNAGTVPSSCADLVSPSADATDVAVDIESISWDVVADATGYSVSINGSTSNMNDISDQDTTGTSFTLPGNFDNGETVSVTIIPFNTNGDAVGCTAPQNFTIVAAAPSVPGSCSDLVSPLADATDVAVDVGSISWTTVSDATGYRVSINGSTSDVNDITDQDITGTSFSLPANFDSGETVSVTITPFNTNGDTVGCTAPHNFTIVTDELVVPACTELIAELNGANDVAVTTSIAWNDVNTADGYLLSIRTEAGVIILPETDLGMLTTYTLSEDLPFATTIFVSIAPYNATGLNSSCTEQTFTTEEEPDEPEDPEIEDDTKYGFSPDGDGINEFWVIDGIENHPENTVTIYNRWGDAIFQISGYDNNANAFRGEANKKTKMGAGRLPSGTYFFEIQIDGQTILKKTKGYVVIKR